MRWLIRDADVGHSSALLSAVNGWTCSSEGDALRIDPILLLCLVEIASRIADRSVVRSIARLTAKPGRGA